jgi:hypothetical protein
MNYTMNLRTDLGDTAELKDNYYQNCYGNFIGTQLLCTGLQYLGFLYNTSLRFCEDYDLYLQNPFPNLPHQLLLYIENITVICRLTIQDVKMHCSYCRF